MRVLDARQVTAENVDELIEWCDGERSYTPGFLIALKAWTCTTMCAAEGDWIVLDEYDRFRFVSAREFHRNYVPQLLVSHG